MLLKTDFFLKMLLNLQTLNFANLQKFIGNFKIKIKLVINHIINEIKYYKIIKICRYVARIHTYIIN